LQVSPYVGEKSQFFGPEDSISLSLEYYQAHLDATPSEGVEVSSNRADLVDKSVAGDRHKVNGAKESEPKGEGEKRFLQCPAAVSMKHLQKFIRMKFALTQNHKVGDVTFSCLWQR
jgi:polycomb group RING finger protein 4